MMDIYREFRSGDEAEQWAEQSFPDLYGKALNENEDFDELFLYGGNNYTPINRSLRSDVRFDEDTDRRIDHLTNILSKHFTPEPIIVYRYTSIKAIRSLCGKRIIRKGTCFTDKAFVSTSLLRSAIKKYKEANHCNCLLKIYVPKGTNGVYISYEKTNSLLKERELLLQRGLAFEIVKVHFLSCPLLIECKIIQNSITDE